MGVILLFWVLHSVFAKLNINLLSLKIKYRQTLLMLTNSSILVTGGTGSFGHKFVPMTLAKYNPRRLVIYSRDERSLATPEISNRNLLFIN